MFALLELNKTNGTGVATTLFLVPPVLGGGGDGEPCCATRHNFGIFQIFVFRARGGGAVR